MVLRRPPPMPSPMRVLFLYPYLPSRKCGHGSAQVVGHLLAGLRSHAEITLVAGYRPAEEEFLPDVAASVHRLIPVPRPLAADLASLPRLFERARTAGWILRSGLPLPLVKLWRRGFRDALRDAFSTGVFDVFHAELSVMAPYIRFVPGGTPAVLVDHEAGGDGSAWRRLVAGVYARYDCLATLSAEDRGLLAEALPGARIVVRSPGVVVPERVERKPEPHRVLFFGSGSHAPNRDALHWISEEILPRLLRLCPEARLACAGTPAAEFPVRALRNHPRVDLLGFVPSIASEIDRSSVVLSPVRLGRGVRIKNLETLARGGPLVTTRLGARGLLPGGADGFLLAEGPDALAESVAGLLRDPARAEALGAAGRAFVSSRFCPEAEVESTLDVWRELLESRRAAAR